MRETLVVQGVLALIGVAFVVVGGAYLSTSVPFGLLGAVGGLLVIGGALVVVLRNKRTMSAGRGLLNLACESKAEWVRPGEVPNERAEQWREYDGDHPEGFLHLGQVAGSRNLDDGVRDTLRRNRNAS